MLRLFELLFQPHTRRVRQPGFGRDGINRYVLITAKHSGDKYLAKIYLLRQSHHGSREIVIEPRLCRGFGLKWGGHVLSVCQEWAFLAESKSRSGCA